MRIFPVEKEPLIFIRFRFLVEDVVQGSLSVLCLVETDPNFRIGEVLVVNVNFWFLRDDRDDHAFLSHGGEVLGGAHFTQSGGVVYPGGAGEENWVEGGEIGRSIRNYKQIRTSKNECYNKDLEHGDCNVETKQISATQIK